MARVAVPHDRARSFEKQYLEVLEAKWQSKAKSAKVHPGECVWYLDWWQEVRASSFDELLTEIRKGPQTPKKLSVLQRVQALKLYVQLVAVSGRGNWISKTIISPFPREILDIYRKQFEEEDAEDDRLALLTEEERDKELDSLLKDLEQEEGFFKLEL